MVSEFVLALWQGVGLRLGCVVYSSAGGLSSAHVHSHLHTILNIPAPTVQLAILLLTSPLTHSSPYYHC